MHCEVQYAKLFQWLLLQSTLSGGIPQQDHRLSAQDSSDRTSLTVGRRQGTQWLAIIEYVSIDVSERLLGGGANVGIDQTIASSSHREHRNRRSGAAFFGKKREYRSRGRIRN